MRFFKNTSSLILITILSLGSIAAMSKSNTMGNHTYEMKKNAVHALHKTSIRHQAKMDRNKPEKSGKLASLAIDTKLVGG